MLAVSLILVFLVNYALGQTDLDTKIEEIYGTNQNNAKGKSLDTMDDVRPKNPIESLDNKSPIEGNLNLQPSATSDTGNGSCIYVSYYLCVNNSIITNGTGIVDLRIDNDDLEYMSVCCGKDEILPEPIVPTPKDEKPTGCGSRNPDGIGFRITGEKHNEAQFGEFPWMVAILREEFIEGIMQQLFAILCGGALIHPKVVLTSAHCVSGSKSNFKIRAGEWDTQTTNELFPHQERNIKTIIIHPEYYAGGLFNDIALLILESPVEITSHINIVCLPKQDLVVENARCFAAGWGKDVFGKEGKYQFILKKIDLPIVPRDTCQTQLRKTRLGKHFTLNPSFICAGGEEGKDACNGDGGSPLVCPIPGQPGKWFQAGIVSWGDGCAKKDVPGIYANVAKFSDWIDEQLALHQINNIMYKY